MHTRVIIMSNGSDTSDGYDIDRPDCVNGFINYVPEYVKVIAGITCVLSMLGVLIIVLTYVCYKNFQSKAREIIVHISLMDFVVACSNFIGITVDFNSRLYHVGTGDLPQDYNVQNNLCIAQAAFAMYGTLGSIQWTIAIAIYFYIRIMVDDVKIAKRSVYGFYIVCYTLPLIMTIWFGATGKIGYSPIGGSGWCSLIVEERVGDKKRFAIFFGNNLWLYLTMIILPAIAISLLIHLKIQVKKESMSQQGISTVHTIETKLLSIPILFVLLRMWSFFLVFISLHTSIQSCGLSLFLLVMGGIGDSGQGFFNAIIFCLLNPKIRKSYWNSGSKYWGLIKKLVKFGKEEDPVTLLATDSNILNYENSSQRLSKPPNKVV